ncbi:YcfA family protein [Nitrosococcus halophilus Nc 4]|uniref:YcfA family protein n=1 Tax=Nitrosococcus halophilus (strain Nc4) TaxID=472759 RepID=D5C4G9_NITHN|nr:type II toxin-antitoxin system HicA family toxin [Nitrosococcus halophilus]ADE15153.1 YcfA family protein [Nitrosococcus halophilus Nc 4]
MPSIPTLSGQEVVKVFSRCGWKVVRQRGSHIIMVKEGYTATLSVPNHKEAAKGTLRSLIRLADLSIEQFLEEAKSV